MRCLSALMLIVFVRADYNYCLSTCATEINCCPPCTGNNCDSSDNAGVVTCSGVHYCNINTNTNPYTVTPVPSTVLATNYSGTGCTGSITEYFLLPAGCTQVGVNSYVQYILTSSTSLQYVTSNNNMCTGGSTTTTTYSTCTNGALFSNSGIPNNVQFVVQTSFYWDSSCSTSYYEAKYLPPGCILQPNGQYALLTCNSTVGVSTAYSDPSCTMQVGAPLYVPLGVCIPANGAYIYVTCITPPTTAATTTTVLTTTTAPTTVLSTTAAPAIAITSAANAVPTPAQTAAPSPPSTTSSSLTGAIVGSVLGGSALVAIGGIIGILLAARQHLWNARPIAPPAHQVLPFSPNQPEEARVAVLPAQTPAEISSFVFYEGNDRGLQNWRVSDNANL